MSYEKAQVDRIVGEVKHVLEELRKPIMSEGSDWLQNLCDRQRLERECEEWIARWSSAQYASELQQQIDRLHGCLRVLQNVTSPTAVDTMDLEELGGPDFAAGYQPPDANTVAAWEAAIAAHPKDKGILRAALMASQGALNAEIMSSAATSKPDRHIRNGRKRGEALGLPDLPVPPHRRPRLST